MAEPKPSAYQEAKAQYGNLTGVDQQNLEDALGGLQFYFRDYYNSSGDEIEGARGRYQQNVREMMAAAPEPVRNYIQATNEGRMLDMLNNQQFYAEDVLPSDAAAREALIYSGKVPYGYAERERLGHGVLGATLDESNSNRYGAENIPEEIFFGGERVGTSTPVHEGYHLATNPRYKEEKGVRGLDYYRAKLTNDAGTANRARQFLLDEYGLDIRKPRDLGELRMNTLRQVMSIRPDYFKNLPEEVKDRFRKALEGRMETGMISSIFGGDPEFDTEGFTVGELGDMPEEQFIEMLRDAPAFEQDGSYDYLRYEGPRMVPEGDSVVRGYEDGGPVGPQDDLFPDTIKEGIGTLVEYAPKVAKIAGRGIGDLVRSEPVSPPKFAVDRPTELTEFQMDTEILLPEELDMISDSVIGKLYSDDVVQRLEDPEERAGLFLYADKPGVTDAPPKSALLRDTVRRSLEEQKNAFDKIRYEGQAGLREEVPLLSRSAVMKNVFNVLRDQIGPEAMSRIGEDRLQKMVEQSVRESTVKGMAAGGVVSLKDKAVNMTRGPRSNGIMQYVPYMTGATNGY